MIHKTILTIRQWTFPKEFRISIKDAPDWADALVASVSETLAFARAPSQPNTPRPQVEVSHESIPPDFAVSVCNQLFRLQRNAEKLDSEGGGSKETRSLRRAIEKLESLLKDHDVEWLDLTDQVYDDGRTDFDPVGPPEEVAGIDRMKIALCERPAVFINRKLAQKARGIVARPSPNQNK